MPRWKAAAYGPPGRLIRATNPSLVRQPSVSLIGSRNSSTASPGVLAAKGNHRDHHRHATAARIVKNLVELASVVAAEELLATHIHQPPRLLVEELVRLLIVEEADPAGLRLGCGCHGPPSNRSC